MKGGDNNRNDPLGLGQRWASVNQRFMRASQGHVLYTRVTTQIILVLIVSWILKRTTKDPENLFAGFAHIID